MKDFPLYRLEVAPLSILPLSRSPFFSYASSVPIASGSLISISFGKQTLEGVVFDCVPLPGKKPYWMKSVNKILRESFLTDIQLELAEQISEEYFTPLGKVLKHFLPKVAKERKKAISEKKGERVSFKPTKEEEAVVKKYLKAKKNIPLAVDTSGFTDPKRVYIGLAKEVLKKKEQVLILVPEITLIAPLTAFFESFFEEEGIVELHSKISTGAFFASWERIRSGEARIIIGTRQALFAPFSKLGLVIVTEEQDESYKQWDMSPKYHAKRVASFLAFSSKAKLVLASPTPSTETLLALEEKQLVPLAAFPKHDPLKNVTLVNLRLERYRKNFSPISETLKEEIAAVLKKGDQVLLYINRQGINAFSVCESCKNVFRCKECDHPLGATKDGRFRCSSCGYTTALFPSCPTCGHLQFRHVGFGTEKVEREVQKLFSSAVVKRFDSTTLTSGKAAKNLYTEGRLGKIDILVGTQMVLKDPPLPRLSLVAIIDADSLLAFPDFSADEKLYQSLSRAVRQVVSGKVIVQTFHPEGAFFEKAATLSNEDFFERALEERKALFYPPFSRSLLVTVTGKTAEESKKKSEKLSTDLSSLFPKSYRLTPLPEHRSLKRKKLFETRFLLRFPHEETLTPKIVSFLKKNSKDILIDLDPLSLR